LGNSDLRYDLYKDSFRKADASPRYSKKVGKTDPKSPEPFLGRLVIGGIKASE
jgi:hypothetical protein